MRRRDQHAADPPALGRRPVRRAPRSGSTWCTTCPASARTCRITSRCTSSTRAPSRSRWRRTWWYRLIGFRWLFFRSGPGATNHFEGGGFARSNDDVGAEPDVPLPADRRALRRLGAGERSRLPGPHRADVLGRGGSVRIASPDPRVHPALRFNYLSTDQTASGSRRSRRGRILDPRDAMRFDGRISPAPRADGRADPRWVAGDAETAFIPPAPARWGPTRCRWSTLDDARPRLGRPPRRRRVGLPLRRERQHLRPGDDGGWRRRPT